MTKILLKTILNYQQKILRIKSFRNCSCVFNKIFILNFWLLIILIFFHSNNLLAQQVIAENFANNNSLTEKFRHGISLFGDLKYPRDFTKLEYVDVNAKKGGEIKYGVEGGFNSLNNFILKGLPAQGLSLIYDSLADSVDDEIGSRYGLIASGIKISQDRTKIDFLLRKTAYFHDGKKITADDVVFTFNKLITEGHPSYKMSYRDVERVEKINDYLVRFILKNNQNRNLPLLIASLPILPKHFYEKHDFSKSSLDIPLGSGPYKIKEFVANRSIVYQRVANYWGKDLPLNRGRHNFDKIIYDYYRDNNVLVEAIKAQKYDIRIENIARNWANSYNIEAIKKGEIIKAEIPHEIPAPTQAFIFNLRKPYFQNIALRIAMTQVFDFEWLQERIFYGSYLRNQSYFTNSEYGISDFKFPKSKGDGFNRENLIIAQNELAKAGYKLIDNKLIDPQSKLPVQIEFLIDQKAFEMVIAPFIKNLKKLGISAKMRFVDENQFQTRVNNFDYDIIVGVIPQSIVPGSELFATFHSSQRNIKGSANLLGLNDKYVDELVEKITNAKTKTNLKILTKKLDSHLLNNYYTIPQWYNNKHRILYRNIFEFPQKSPKYSLAIDSWWYKNN